MLHQNDLQCGAVMQWSKHRLFIILLQMKLNLIHYYEAGRHWQADIRYLTEGGNILDPNVTDEL